MNKLVPLATILQSYAEEYFPEICGQDLTFSLTGSPDDPMVSIGRGMSSCPVNEVENTEFRISLDGSIPAIVTQAIAEKAFKPVVPRKAYIPSTRRGSCEVVRSCQELYDKGESSISDLAKQFKVPYATMYWRVMRSRKLKKGASTPCP